MIKIESGIPLPPIQRRGRPFGELREALLSIDVGDSFETDKGETHIRGVAAKCWIKVAIRSVSNKRRRVWRVE